MEAQVLDFSPGPVTANAFRQQQKSYLDLALKNHVPFAVSRAHDAAVGIFMDSHTVRAIIGTTSFSPEVDSDGSQISVWLPELEIYGIGETAADAEADLLDEVQHYVIEYFTEGYHSAPNRVGHLPFVMTAYVAQLEGNLRSTIFQDELVTVSAT